MAFNARLPGFRIKSSMTDLRQAPVNVPEMFERLSGTVAHETVNPLTR
jgi:hypothetical protein